jgi:hypothetical protein
MSYKLISPEISPLKTSFQEKVSLQHAFEHVSHRPLASTARVIQNIPRKNPTEVGSMRGTALCTKLEP